MDNDRSKSFKGFTIIGTSGATDYLEDKTGSQRFWRASAPSAPVDGESACDGIHDEGEPIHHLCTRCFPDLIDRSLRGDLALPEDDERDERAQDEAEEID